MKNKLNKSVAVSAAVLCCLMSCSSAPKRAMQYTDTRDAAVLALEQASSFIFAGKFSEAKDRLDSAYKLAVSVDSPDILIAVCLARVSFELSADSIEQNDSTPEKNEPGPAAPAPASAPAPAVTSISAAAGPASEASVSAAAALKHLQKARQFVQYSSDPVKNDALCTISAVRIALASGGGGTYDEQLKDLETVLPVFTKDVFNTAAVLMLKGDILRQRSLFGQAETSYMQAADIFTVNRYLNEIGLAWYKTAQVRSLAGNRSGAFAALENAVKFDRDAENTRALGTDYYIYGTLLARGQPTADEKKKAVFFLNHSAEIFDAAGFTSLAQRSRKKAVEIQ